jgi:sortase A
MWKKIVFWIAVVMLVTGIGFLLFPPISNFIGSQIAKAETEEFDAMIDSVVSEDDCSGGYEEALKNGEIDEQGYPIDENGNRTASTPLVYEVDIERLYQDSLAYNENLRTNQGRLLVSDYSYTQPSIDLQDYGIYNGIYGYISAPSINMELPIYLGANNDNMSYGAAHLTYTSLPIGGSRSNAVLAGHTGYVGRIFFDNIRNLEIGDEVYLKNYWSTLTYKVTDTAICAPNQSQAIFINDDRDLLTLITCISDGKGDFNRYYVILENTENN